MVTIPPLAPGFVGPGHLAAPVVSPEDFVNNDPFIALMDDHSSSAIRRRTSRGSSVSIAPIDSSG
jgi:hypothetical protein